MDFADAMRQVVAHDMRLTRTGWKGSRRYVHRDRFQDAVMLHRVGNGANTERYEHRVSNADMLADDWEFFRERPGDD